MSNKMFKDVSKNEVSYAQAVRSYVEAGRKIPATLWRENPGFCQRVKSEVAAENVSRISALVSAGHTAKLVESKTGASMSLRVNLRVRDGVKRDGTKLTERRKSKDSKIAELEQELQRLQSILPADLLEKVS